MNKRKPWKTVTKLALTVYQSDTAESAEKTVLVEGLQRLDWSVNMPWGDYLDF